MNNLSIKELHIILGELIADGYGDREFQLYYDSECVYTNIPKRSRIFIFKKGIRFSDYEELFISKERTIEGILDSLGDKNG